MNGSVGFSKVVRALCGVRTSCLQCSDWGVRSDGKSRQVTHARRRWPVMFKAWTPDGTGQVGRCIKWLSQNEDVAIT